MWIFVCLLVGFVWGVLRFCFVLLVWVGCFFCCFLFVFVLFVCFVFFGGGNALILLDLLT